MSHSHKARVGESTLLNVPEAGRLLGVSESTVWRMIRRRALPSVMKGGRRYIPQDALEQRAINAAFEDVPPFTKDHPIFQLVGAGRGGGGTLGARDKHAILDDS